MDKRWLLILLIFMVFGFCGCGKDDVEDDVKEDDKKEEEIIEEHVHTLVHVSGIDATCTTDGYSDYDYCTGCDYSTISTIPALGHDYEIVETKEATCEEDAYIKYECSRCGDIYTATIKTLGHNFIHVEGKAATFDEDGYTDYYRCDRCGREEGKEIIPKLEHHETHEYEVVDTVPATLEEAGYIIYKCKHCEDEMIEYLNPFNKSASEIDNIKILLVGNSFTNYNTLMKCLEGMFKGEGKNITVDKCAYGSQYLHNYIKGADHYKYLVGMTSSTKYDLAFLQEQSKNTMVDPGDFYSSSRELVDFFKEKGTKVAFYSTWSDKNGYPNRAYSVLDVTEKVEAAYDAIASEVGSLVSKTGVAIYLFGLKHPEIELYASDGNHPSTIGTYIASLCHYILVFGKKVDKMQYTYNDYVNDSSITFHAKTLEHISDELQNDIIEICNEAMFGSSIVSEENITSSIGVERNLDQLEGFNKKIEVDNSVEGTIDVTYKVTSGSWNVSVDSKGKTSFSNTADKSVLMFQEELIEEKDLWYTLSFDFVLKEEVESYTYARGILLASYTPSLSYFDGNEALILGRRRYNTSIALQAMRVYDPAKYNVSGYYSFDRGFDLVRVEHLVTELNKIYHIQIYFNISEQKYGVYVNGVLSGYVIGVDLPKGGYMGLFSFDSNKMTFSNFKLNCYELRFSESK